MVINMKERKLDGFVFNFTIYFISLLIASLMPFFARFVLSFFIETPGIAELQADGSYLFNVIYPIMGSVTIAVFLFGGYLACYIAGYKIAYKIRTAQKIRKIKLQIITTGIAIFIWNLYMGFTSSFMGLYSIQFWYPSALTASLFGLVDKKNLLFYLQDSDIDMSNFVIAGINSTIGFFILAYAIIISIPFMIFAYIGRLKGEVDGLDSIAKYVNELKNETTTKNELKNG